ncbi:MAG TPA: glycosyltransferase family 1 protein [Chloroflexia bacterium]|nr:glycosyltransferase family 1 protein [Chloroflexia bacterium]
MRIGINAHLLSFSSSYRQAGLSRYIHELVARVPRVDPSSDFLAFVGSGEVPEQFTSTQPPNLRLLRSKLPTERAPFRILWEQTALPLATVSSRMDLLHCPVNVRPFASRCPVVITIHDLIFLRFPEAFHPAKRTYLKYMTAWSARKADHVITVSEATRRDVIDLLGVKPARVTTAHNGVGEQFVRLPDTRVEEFRAGNDLPADLVFYMGTLEPRKNTVTLLRAFRAMIEKPGFGNTVLCIGGSKGWYYDEIFRVAGELELVSSGRVRFLGRVPDEELPLWYNVASVFVYPSLYEGFGLPPLEAMACGTPVIVSDNSSLVEVVSDAGIRLPADEPARWAEEMARVLAEPSLAARLADEGAKRASQFTWDRTARETVRIYKQVLGRTGRKVARRSLGNSSRLHD